MASSRATFATHQSTAQPSATQPSVTCWSTTRQPASARRSVPPQESTERRSRRRRSRTQSKRSPVNAVSSNQRIKSRPSARPKAARIQRRMSAQHISAQLSPKIRRQALWTGGAIASLVALVVLPTRVASQAMLQSSCEQVVQPNAEISRSQLAQLAEVPTGSSQSAIQQIVAQPHCTLPSLPAAVEPAAKEQESAEPNAKVALTERHAYPLAFDSEAWVILAYEADIYSGYDFVFKP